MDRRDFLKMCSVAGLGLVSTGLPAGRARALGGQEKFWVFVNANGGWDHTRSLDPKGDAPNSDGVVVNQDFATDAFGVAGNISYAPVGINDQFFQRFYTSMTVFRGINVQTNGHDDGRRNTFSGRLIEGTPALAALIASAHGGTKPLAYITNGGYDVTDGLIAPTRLGDTNALQALIYPNRINPGDENSALYHTDKTFESIMATRQERTDVYRSRQQLPRINNAMSLLYTSRLGMADLKGIIEYLPDNLGNGLARQAAIGLAAYKAGLAQSCNLSIGGFDSHGNNDQQQDQQQSALFQGVIDMFNQAETLGVADEIVCIIGSDFGRTPSYNAGNGKDHWSVGSMAIIASDLPGDRVIGETDDGLRHKKLDPATNAVSDSGEDMTPGTIHRWLRKYAGIEGEEATQLYPISDEGEFDFG